MRRIRVNVQNIVTNTIVSEGNDTNVSMVENIFAKKESKRAKTNIDIGNYSWKVVFVFRYSCKRYPIGVMAGSNKRFIFTVRRAGSFANFRPRWFLDKKDVILRVRFEDGVGDERVLSNIL